MGRMGRYEEALPFLEEAYRKKAANKGTRSPSTLLTQYFLAVTLEALGRTADALKIYQEIYRIKKKELGNVHMHAFLAKEDITDEILADKIESLGGDLWGSL